MGISYLLDSNTVIQYVGNKFPSSVLSKIDSIIDEELLISVITVIEVLGFNGEPDEMNTLKSFTNMATVISLADEIVDETISIRKQYKIKIPDAIIAATAIKLNATLITSNISDFLIIKGITLIDPSQL